MLGQTFGERVNQVLDGVTPTAFRAFSSCVKQTVGIWIPPSIWLTACVLVGLGALYLLLRAARGTEPRQ